MPPTGAPSLFWTILLFATAFGACLGSFVNVIAHRWPRELSVVRPPSHCPACNTSIAWYDNIPVVSWLVLGGRCRHCQTSISFRYPLVEVLMAGLSGALAWKLLVFQITADAIVAFDPLGFGLSFAGHLTIVTLLVSAAVIDLRHYLVPHILTIPAMLVGLLVPWLHQSRYPRTDAAVWWPPVTPTESLAGFLAGALIIVGIFGLYWAIRQTEGMGGGDVTLMAVVGAWLGWPALVFIFFASSLQGTLAAGVSWLASSDWLKPSSQIIDATSAPNDGSDAPSQDRGSDKLALPFGPFIVLAALEHFYLGDLLPRVVSMSYLYTLWGLG
jgi:leader peptidase (prepilin peptidase)/N-methyltransferase